MSRAAENRLVKKPNVQTRYTEDQLVETLRCVNDPIYFVETFLRIQHPVLGAVPFTLYDFQKRIIQAFDDHRFNILLAARQVGKTTCAVGYLLWFVTFNPDKTILIAANKYSQALEIMDRVRYGYENLPDYIRPGVTKYNEGSIHFDNGSRIVSRATSKDAARGLAISLLYLDEFSHVPPNKAKEFFTSVQPTLSTGGACIVTSTPNNDEDQFAQIWHGAVDNTDEYGNPSETGEGKNGFFPVKVMWDEHPDRDEKWAQTWRNTLGEVAFRREYECSFLSADETLIDPLTLSRLTGQQPAFYTNTVRWYRDPQPNRTFLVALDPSLGTGGNNGAIEVFQLPEMVQIGEWQHNMSAPRTQVRILLQTLLYLRQSLADSMEQNGEPEIYWTVENNSIGEAILQIIEDTGEEKFPGNFVHERKRKGQVRRFRKGMNTDPRKKLSACARMKSLLESNRMVINSGSLIHELKNFVALENSFKAKSGKLDDLVSASLLVCRMLDVVLNWSLDEIHPLREMIDPQEAYIEPMPVLV